MVDTHLTSLPEEIINILESVKDPEVPVLSVLDLGVIRDVKIDGKNIAIKLTPTYSGCPAMDTIAMDLKLSFAAKEYLASVELVLAPAWTTDWISEKGRQALIEYGITPPMAEAADKSALIHGEKIIPCPRCTSTNTKMISQFGSTACKALFQCNDCLEPFDYFKCLK